MCAFQTELLFVPQEEEKRRGTAPSGLWTLKGPSKKGGPKPGRSLDSGFCPRQARCGWSCKEPLIRLAIPGEIPSALKRKDLRPQTPNGISHSELVRLMMNITGFHRERCHARPTCPHRGALAQDQGTG